VSKKFENWKRQAATIQIEFMDAMKTAILRRDIEKNAAIESELTFADRCPCGKREVDGQLDTEQ
jgi:hypothetical protein